MKIRQRHPSTTHVVIGSIICTLLVMGLGALVNKALGYQKCSDTTGASSQAAGYACTSMTPRHEVRRFKHHKIGNAKGYTLPGKLRRKLDRKASRMVHGRDLGDHWWDFPFDASQCIYWHHDVSDCTYRAGQHAGAALTKDLRHVTRVTIGCGGDGIIGHYVYKSITGAVVESGWVGIGAGVAVCLAQRTWDHWWP